mgnify:CR=1 FL=1
MSQSQEIFDLTGNPSNDKSNDLTNTVSNVDVVTESDLKIDCFQLTPEKTIIYPEPKLIVKFRGISENFDFYKQNYLESFPNVIKMCCLMRRTAHPIFQVLQENHFAIINSVKKPIPLDKLSLKNVLRFLELDVPEKLDEKFRTVEGYGSQVWKFLHFSTLCCNLLSGQRQRSQFSGQQQFSGQPSMQSSGQEQRSEKLRRNCFIIMSNLDSILACGMCMENYKQKQCHLGFVPAFDRHGEPIGCAFMIHNVVNKALNKEIYQINDFSENYRCLFVSGRKMFIR